jgi:hypothetical protein
LFAIIAALLASLQMLNTPTVSKHLKLAFSNSSAGFLTTGAAG